MWYNNNNNNNNNNIIRIALQNITGRHLSIIAHISMLIYYSFSCICILRLNNGLDCIYFTIKLINCRLSFVNLLSNS